MKMMPPDVISHENQLQHLSQPSIFILDVFRTADHAGQIFIPHRPGKPACFERWQVSLSVCLSLCLSLSLSLSVSLSLSPSLCLSLSLSLFLYIYISYAEPR